MEAVASTQQPQSTEGLTRAQRHKRPRPGRGRGSQPNASLSLRPASIAPEASNSSSGPSAETGIAGTERSTDPTNPGRGRGRGRGRGGKPHPNRTVNGRQFGGQLTGQDTSITETAPATQLQGDASEFIPGQQFSRDIAEVHLKTHSKPQRTQKRRASKSQAPDIATRIHEDIDNAQYECLICFSEVRRNSKVWSCNTCWTVFHLSCVKKWAANEGSAAARQNDVQDGDMAHPRQWRCPGCNLPKMQVPHTFSCWCEKEIDPRSLPGLPPHSCGNTCAKDRGCPHPCSITCHAGPCLSCSTMTTQVCFCGKHEVTKRCSETDYSGWSCGEVCGELMPCGEHLCSQLCHEGYCGTCLEPTDARCYCGQVQKDIVCGEKGETKTSHRANTFRAQTGVDSELHSPTGSANLEIWQGSFDCGNICGRDFDCGEHRCQKRCHAQEAEPARCPHSPDLVTLCPCGKTPLDKLMENPREKCTDDIPRCMQPCGSILSCGHLCETTCHSGDCPACIKRVDIKCRCGRTTSKSICYQGQTEPPHCDRLCKAQMNCLRHSCDERCCPGERKATERQGSKRKQRPLDSMPRSLDADFEAEHICTRVCGRSLKCGLHTCQELCHRGSCPSCKEAIFDEVSCHCGRTVLQPPLPCGTTPPPCSYPCTRPKTCGHQQVAHNCHDDNISCPKCPYLVEKHCMCGKKSLKNQPCWLTDVRCGLICGKKLRCGSHVCRKTCHRSGECEDAHGKPCEQPCGKLKKACGHPDIEDNCHAPFPCKEEKPCQSKIYITCDCQAQKQEMRCAASKTSEGNIKKTLPCNDECARLERNRKLAVALNIDQSTHAEGGDHVPYASTTLDVFAANVQWAQVQEREFRVFADAADEKRLRFKPMRSQQRTFIHSLAEDFGFDSESMDPEPHRHVMIWKTPRFVSAPRKTLADALRIRQAQRSAHAVAVTSDSEGQSQSRIRAPYNSFIISKPRFGLTVDELREETDSLLRPEMPLTFNIEFLPNEQVIMKAVSRTLTNGDLSQTLQSMKEPLVAAISAKGFGTPEMCATDNSLNVLRRESESGQSDGWSKIVSKKAAPKMISTTGDVAGNNTFSALSSGKITLTKKQRPEKIQRKKEAVVDDWETAELAEEEKERVTNGGSGDEEEGFEPSTLTKDTGLDSQDESSLMERKPEIAENESMEATLNAGSETEKDA